MSYRVRIVVCICILSFLFSAIYFTAEASKLVHEPEYTFFSHSTATTNGVYFAEDWNGKGWVYNLDFSGKVKEMMCSSQVYEDHVHNIIVSGGKVYAVFSTLFMEDGEAGRVINITEMDENLNPERQIDDYVLDASEFITGFSYDGEFFYITTLETKKVNVYQIPISEMKDVSATPVLNGIRSEKKLSEMSFPDDVYYKELERDGAFVDAVYRDEKLFVRTDRDVPYGPFLKDVRIDDALSKIRFSPLQNIRLYREYFIVWLGVCIIWLILVFLIYRLLRRRNRVIYLALVMEFLILINLVASFYFVRNRYLAASHDEASRFAVLSLQSELDMLGSVDNIDAKRRDFYESPEYTSIYKSVKRFCGRDGNYLMFEDAFLVRLSDGVIIADGFGINRDKISRVYGQRAEEAVEMLKRGGRSYVTREIFVNGSNNFLVGVVKDDLASHKYALMGVITGEDPFVGIWGTRLKLLFFFAAIFLESSIIILIILYFQHADLRHLEKEIREVALGKTKVKVPKTEAEDMKSIWNSLSEVGKRIESVNYERFRVFEAYNRFAPKDIETIMNKDSIFDVKSGDTANVEGSLMLVSIEEEGEDTKRIKSLNNVVSYMDNYVGDREGIMVSHDSALSMLEFLFLLEYNNTVSKAVQLIHRNDTDEESAFISVFIYQASFMYGVVGINDKCLTYLTSTEVKEMEAYSSWFAKMRVPLVITEWIKNRENPETLRYIGYIMIENNPDKIKVYEALDACPARVRQLKLSVRERFEESIEAYYNRDFYLARNSFTEILKDCPEDNIARWYLFQSEKYLNDGVDKEDFGALGG